MSSAMSAIQTLLFSNNVFNPCTMHMHGNRYSPNHYQPAWPCSTSWHRALHPGWCSGGAPSITLSIAVAVSQTMRSLLFTSPGTCRRLEAH